tara:strand:- start:3267 stop:3779 length:513 start_codon:yes stop_codon:yes gene_type:complete
MALISTPGAADANSYVDYAEANVYLTTERLYSDAWTAVTQAKGETALIWATSLLDANMTWEGTNRTLSQSLRFPRTGLFDRDGNNILNDIIPANLKTATADLALFLLRSDRTAIPSIIEKGLKSVRADVVSIEVDHLRKPDLIPLTIIASLADLGYPSGASGGGVPVIRT